MLVEQDFKTISDVIYRHCGINLHDGKQELVEARIAKRVRETGFPSARAYIDHVLADTSGDEFGHLVDAISTNLTSFFRESNHFHYLVEHHLPGLLDRKRARNDNRIRAWSAGCSSGEEPYTLAMVLTEATENEPTATAGRKWDVKILATDISRKILAKAKAGAYEKLRLKDVPQFMQAKYFGPGPDKHTVVVGPELKRRIAFNYLNLMEPWPFTGPMDVIFCRNVMIYFDKPTQEKLVNRYYDMLDPGGVLFTGHSESLTGIRHKFRYTQPTIYVKG
ncbi:MAG TPA: protein-glutamate O-methyltransferase [Tepidisphaeraceae bacterium]|nr:protein-glutamate O-methyltransferase [Tepidisphaeraceae bacterium]